MEPEGKFYELRNSGSLKRDLEEKGFELKRSYADNFEIHYSGINSVPFGFLLNDEFLLIRDDRASYIKDDGARAKRKENFDNLELIVKEAISNKF